LLIIGLAYFCAGIFPPDPMVPRQPLRTESADWSSPSVRQWYSRW
jgi:hypothetical protein